MTYIYLEEIHGILSRQASFEERAQSACTAKKELAERVQALESELGVWKRAYEDVVRGQGGKDKDDISTVSLQSSRRKMLVKYHQICSAIAWHA